MFSKPIFTQTLKANYKLWLIFTVILCSVGAMIILTFDPNTMSSMTEMIASIGGNSVSPFGDMSSLLSILSSSLYGMIGVVLPLIYIIITANSLVASKVDNGSMAYLLSTPIKRSKVVRTQGAYLITAILCMFLTVTIVGVASVQLVHGGVFGTTYTEDVTAAADVLNLDKSEVADDLNLILEDSDALKAGAEARQIDEDVYTAYLGLKIADNAMQAAADVLDVDMKDVKADPSLIQANDEALNAGAEVMGTDSATYSTYLDMLAGASSEEIAAASKQASEMMAAGLTAAAEILDINTNNLASDMSQLLENDDALAAAVQASGISEENFVSIINQQLASKQLSLDAGVDFNLKDYLMLNLGCFLLMFAISSISFLFSCIFNLSKYSMALGAGIPIAFFLFQMMGQISESFEVFKYLSLNTLFDTSAIISGGNYWVQFTVLGVLGVLLYSIGTIWFKKKDLPL